MFMHVPVWLGEFQYGGDSSLIFISQGISTLFPHQQGDSPSNFYQSVHVRDLLDASPVVDD